MDLMHMLGWNLAPNQFDTANSVMGLSMLGMMVMYLEWKWSLRLYVEMDRKFKGDMGEVSRGETYKS